MCLDDLEVSGPTDLTPTDHHRAIESASFDLDELTPGADLDRNYEGLFALASELHSASDFPVAFDCTDLATSRGSQTQFSVGENTRADSGARMAGPKLCVLPAKVEYDRSQEKNLCCLFACSQNRKCRCLRNIAVTVVWPQDEAKGEQFPSASYLVNENFLEVQEEQKAVIDLLLSDENYQHYLQASKQRRQSVRDELVGS